MEGFGIGAQVLGLRQNTQMKEKSVYENKLNLVSGIKFLFNSRTMKVSGHRLIWN